MAAAAAAAAAARKSDDAKLIFGTVFSLRNMVRKLGGDDDAFVAFRTAQYKLHYYETASSLRLVMLTDTATLSMRNVLHQIYINLWVEYGTWRYHTRNSSGGLWWLTSCVFSGQESALAGRAQRWGGCAERAV